MSSSPSAKPSGRIASLSTLSAHYDAVLCDVWGVLHNGVSVYHAAAEALSAFRQQGGQVVMITNSPRPRAGVIAQFGTLGVPDGVFDEVVTSGDATRDLIATTQGPFHHLGPSRDQPLFDGLNVDLVSKETCRAVVCTGLIDDEHEKPEDYDADLAAWLERDVPMICANPDLIVERGDRLIPCAGALAKRYEEMGGRTLVAGKPHKPIYDLALAQLSGSVERHRVIAVGDGLPTDVAGAHANNLDLLYISAGIHSAEYGPPDAPNAEALDGFLKRNNTSTTVWMPRLVW